MSVKREEAGCSVCMSLVSALVVVCVHYRHHYQVISMIRRASADCLMFLWKIANFKVKIEKLRWKEVHLHLRDFLLVCGLSYSLSTHKTKPIHSQLKTQMGLGKSCPKSHKSLFYVNRNDEKLPKSDFLLI